MFHVLNATNLFEDQPRSKWNQNLELLCFFIDCTLDVLFGLLIRGKETVTSIKVANSLLYLISREEFQTTALKPQIKGHNFLDII